MLWPQMQIRKIPYVHTFGCKHSLCACSDMHLQIRALINTKVTSGLVFAIFHFSTERILPSPKNSSLCELQKVPHMYQGEKDTNCISLKKTQTEQKTQLKKTQTTNHEQT